MYGMYKDYRLVMALAMDSVCEGEKWDWGVEPHDMTPYKGKRPQIKSKRKAKKEGLINA